MAPVPAHVSSPIAMTVSVTVEKDESDIWHAHSKDVFGLELCGREKESVVTAIPEAIKFLYRENHAIDVSVRRLCDIRQFPRPVMVDDEFLLETSQAIAA